MRTRAFWIYLSLLVCLLVMAGLCTFLLANSAWLDEQVKLRTVALIHRSIGARTEIGRFHLSWQTLTFEYDDVVLHGREAAQETALFQAAAVRIRIGLVSLLRRDFYVDSITVLRPRFFLHINPDGSTNLPNPRSQDPASLLIDLRVRHIQMLNGYAQINSRVIPFDLAGASVGLALNARHPADGFNTDISAGSLSIVASGKHQRFDRLMASALLQRNRLQVKHLSVVSALAHLELTGVLERFLEPHVEAHLWGSAQLQMLNQSASLRNGNEGTIAFSGLFRYSRASSWMLDAAVSGSDLRIQVGPHRITPVGVQSGLKWTPGHLRFSNFRIRALGSVLSGQALLLSGNALTLDAHLQQLPIQVVSGLLRRGLPALGGMAGGQIHVSGNIQGSGERLAIESHIEIAPLPGPLPVSGTVDSIFQIGSRTISFKRSNVTLAGARIEFEGSPDQALQITAESANLQQLKPVLESVVQQASTKLSALPESGAFRFTGQIHQALGKPGIDGHLDLTNFTWRRESYAGLHADFALYAGSLTVTSASIDSAQLRASANGSLTLRNYAFSSELPVQAEVKITGSDLARIAQDYEGVRLPIIRGVASGSFTVAGTLNHPRGNGNVTVDSLSAYGELLNQVHANISLQDGQISFWNGRIQAQQAFIAFAGTYSRSVDDWKEGRLELQVRSTGFPLSNLSPVARYSPDLDARLEIHAHITTAVTKRGFEPSEVDGNLNVRHISFRHADVGNFSVNASTTGKILTAVITGDLARKGFGGKVSTTLTEAYSTDADIRFNQVDLTTLRTVLGTDSLAPLASRGFLRGSLHVDGSLTDIKGMHELLTLDELTLETTSVPASSANTAELPQVSPSRVPVVFRNSGPLVFDLFREVATVRQFHISGPSTELFVGGTVALQKHGSLDLSMRGSADLSLLQTVRPGLQSGGQIYVAASVNGTVDDPLLVGRAEINKGSILASNFSNGLTDVNGSVVFDGTRATINHLEASSGGGQIELTGFVTFGIGTPLVYNLQANVRNVRFRYGNAISITGDSTLRLTGTSQNGLLSGGVKVTRVVLNTSADLGNLFASTATPTPVPQNRRDLISGLQMDIHVESSDDLQLNTALSQNVQTDLDLHLRGLPDKPVLIGTISANQGDIKIFGAKYTINRGVVSFANAVRIEPVLDLDLQTETRGIAVNITVSGPPNKLNLNYRSDPPLQPKDIIALLTVGQAPSFTTANVGNAQVTNDASTLQAGANTVLGQAVSPVSNRLSKLFGITNIKIDPLVQGITNTPQARLTLEQQISRNSTVTYITNLAQTSEQIFRFEWALNPQYSIVAIRDDNGEFGIDIQFRKRFGGR